MPDNDVQLPSAAAGGNRIDLGSILPAPAPTTPADAKPIGDTSSKADIANKARSDSLPAPENTGGSGGAEKMRGNMGAGNPWLNAKVMVAIRMALDAAIMENAHMRKEARTASLAATNWATAQGKEAAQLTLVSGELQAQMQENEARAHMINGFIAIGTIALTVGAYGGSKVMGSAKQKAKDPELRDLTLKRDTLQARYDNAVNGRPGQGGAPAVPPSAAKQQEIKADLDKADSAVTQRNSHLDQMNTHLTQMAIQLAGQAGNVAKEFNEYGKEIVAADLTRRKARVDSFQKMCETYEKLAQKMMQTADEDAKNASEQISKFLQAMDQIISSGYKSFGIGVHG